MVITDARYIQFGTDVGNLQPTLKRLLDAFEWADGEVHQKEAKELIGDFNGTLKECRELLGNHKGILRDGAGFVQNVRWGLSTQKRVDELRARIQFHIQTINLFLAT